MKLIIKNIGSGLITLGRGTYSLGPKLCMDRKSEIQISAANFLDFEQDIVYLHTAKAGEVKCALELDGETITPEALRQLIDIAPEDFDQPPAEETRTVNENRAVALLVASGLKINYAGPVNMAESDGE